MQQAVLSYIVQQLMSDDERNKAREAFIELDKNQDGKLQRDEILEGYRRIYGDFAEEEVDKIMTQVDIDGSGEIEYSEWLSATSDMKKLLSKERL